MRRKLLSLATLGCGAVVLAGTLALISESGAAKPPKASATQPSSASVAQAKFIQKAHLPATQPQSLQNYLTSPTAVKRKATYATAWDNPKAHLTYPSDGSKQTIQLMKCPFDRVLPMREKARPVAGKAGKKTQKPDKEHNGWVTTSQKIELSASSSTFLNNDYADAAARIYPGAIFTAKDYENGDYKAVQGARSSIDIATDNPNISGSSFVTVKNPNPDQIRNAVATLYGRMKGKAATDGFSSQVYESANNASWALQVSGGASFFGISASNAFSTSSKSSSVYLTIDTTLPLFSITATPTGEGYFADPSVENTPDLVVISNVVYGVRVLANLTITFNSDQSADDFKAGVNWGVASADVMLNYMNKHSDTVSTINTYVIGGGAGDTAGTIALDPKHLIEGIQKIIHGATYANARPIQYQLSDMAGDILESQSFCDVTTVSSAPKDDNPKIAFMDCAFMSGADGKDWDTDLTVYLYDPSYNPPVSTTQDSLGALYGYSSQTHYSWRFGENQEDQVPLTPMKWNGGGTRGFTPDLYGIADFVRMNGGRIRVHIFPNGNDTWDVNQANLILHFVDGTMQSVPLASPGVVQRNFVLSQDVERYDLVFTGKDLTD